MRYQPIATIPVRPDQCRIYEHGWQSWSPSGWYPLSAQVGARPVRPVSQVQNYRPGRPGPARGFQGEGLLAIDPGDGAPVHVFGARPGAPAPAADEIPGIRAEPAGDAVTVSATGPVRHSTADQLDAGLVEWADGYAAGCQVGPIRPAPTAWCSWYHYFTEVTEADVLANLATMTELDLPVDVVQIDDGWQAGIGDWLTRSGRFGGLPELVARIRDTGRRAGIWVAPFLVGAAAQTARTHPDWLIPDTVAGYNWGQDTYGLDLTHPGVRGYLREVFGMLRAAGFDYFKVDFLYAGALAGARYDGSAPLAAYRSGVRLIREAIGPDAYLLGCGAPILPSVGLFDAMRVGPDVAPHYAPKDGDPAQPSQLGAAFSTAGRAFQHGRFWVNDPDCLIARPTVERRAGWAAVIDRYGGLRASSDRLAELDDWGLATTRRLLTEVPPPTPW